MVEPTMPEPEELEPQEWKLLFMLLAENRAGINFYTALTSYGVWLLDSVRRKLGVNVVGVDTVIGEMPPSNLCPSCHQPLTYRGSAEK